MKTEDIMEQKMYKNPVITGFFPDPSVVRVGEDYYLVNSTFQYFPAIVIQHSKDLVHWEIIGHGITENEYLDLTDKEDSHGIWAPDISYHNGLYYIFAPLRLNNSKAGEKTPLRQMLVMTSGKPEGPYSKPITFNIDAIDPSHFIDDDGTHYMISTPGITITKLNNDCTEIVDPPKTVWPGTGLRAAEGPHIFKKDGYYYAILAEGGTGYGHQISVGRSENLYGPYEASPYNPVMTQKDPASPIQRAGHGKIVQTQNGDWWMMYLCGRPNGGNFTTVGRETALDPVQWTDDGWFTVNHLQGPSTIQTAPALPTVIYEELYFDDFDDEKLALNWHFVRNPKNELWSLEERKGFLRMYTGDYDLNDLRAYNTLVRREKDHAYTATTKLEFNPSKNGEQAGLTCYYGIYNYIKLFMVHDNGWKIRLVENRAGSQTCIGESPNINQSVVYLKVDVCKQERRFYYSFDNKQWVLVGVVEDARFLSDEGGQVGKRHTGTQVGIYANNGGNKTKIAADFDWFHYESKGTN